MSIQSLSAPRSEITPAQAREWLLAGRAVLIDVREGDEHAREHIEGAQLMPLSRFDPAKVAALANSGRRVILHCRSGRRSAEASRMCVPLAGGDAPLLTLTGGIDAWKAAGLPVVASRAAPPISIMRQVQLIVGVCTLIGSALAWFVDPAFVGIPAFFGAGLAFAGASGTCAMASLLAAMPWNRVPPSCSAPCAVDPAARGG